MNEFRWDLVQVHEVANAATEAAGAVSGYACTCGGGCELVL